MLEITFKKRDYLHPIANKEAITKEQYIIATTQRSGSTLLCDLLLQTGVCGQPGEYFTPSFVERNQELLAFGNGNSDPINANLGEYIQHIFSRYHLGNGVSGIKVTWDQISRINHDLNRNKFLKASIHKSFNKYFGKSKIIFLRRANITSQAISKHIAFNSEKWHSWDNKTNAVQFSESSIIKFIREIENHNDAWLNLLNKSNAEFINVFYEEICLKPTETISKILQFICNQNIQIENKPLCEIKKTHSSLKVEFEKRFNNQLCL